MEVEISVSYLQVVTKLHPEPDESSHRPYTLFLYDSVSRYAHI
jgi:hypothetical protein